MILFYFRKHCIDYHVLSSFRRLSVFKITYNYSIWCCPRNCNRRTDDKIQPSLFHLWVRLSSSHTTFKGHYIISFEAQQSLHFKALLRASYTEIVLDFFLFYFFKNNVGGSYRSERHVSSCAVLPRSSQHYGKANFRTKAGHNKANRQTDEDYYKKKRKKGSEKKKKEGCYWSDLRSCSLRWHLPWPGLCAKLNKQWYTCCVLTTCTDCVRVAPPKPPKLSLEYFRGSKNWETADTGRECVRDEQERKRHFLPVHYQCRLASVELIQSDRVLDTWLGALPVRYGLWRCRPPLICVRVTQSKQPAARQHRKCRHRTLKVACCTCQAHTSTDRTKLDWRTNAAFQEDGLVDKNL